MIVTQYKPEKEILELLENSKDIFIIGCGSCAEQCKTGGSKDVEKMKNFLIKNDKKVTGYTIPDETCNVPLVKKKLRENSKELKQSDTVLVMACGAGTNTVAQSTIKKVLTILDTVSLASTQRIGDFAGKCSLCGECVLNDTGGICPITLCPKSMLNGPCGGTGEGKCEVNTEEDCVWVGIYNKLKENNILEKVKKIKNPKNYSKRKTNEKTIIKK